LHDPSVGSIVLVKTKTAGLSNAALCYRLTGLLKAKFHYAIWFEAGLKLVADPLRTCLRPASNQLRTS